MGDVRFGRATEWWSRAERDLDLARELGLNALRFSIEWSRIEPRPGEIDRAALDQYRRITEGMVARGLRPVICLHHFTNPLWFEDGGAFLAADAPARFERYAEVVAQRLGDLCTTWLTFNEPNVYALLGYELGEFPPGRRRASIAHARVLAAIARCHARAYRAIHDAQPAAEVGWAQHFLVLDPARPERRLDRWAARTQDAVFNDGFVRTLATGRAAPALRPFVGDLAEVRDCFDFVGLNLYGRVLVRFDLTRPRELFGRREVPPGARTGDGVDAGQPYGEAYPDGLLRIGRRLAALDRPIYVTEHGVADAGDRVRPWVLARGVRQVHALVREGVDVRGYFHWTLTDNVEWNWGWRLRFGLVALDETTQARAVRGSGRLYAAIARANAVSRDLVATYAPDEVEAVFADPA
jgi:beta-glucosidase